MTARLATRSPYKLTNRLDRRRLGAIESEFVELVKKLCEPLFIVFDFASFPDEAYREIVDYFQGKIR